eukprot:scaffold3166_cov399-Prasinococcus_capsulatus_cf.AAC.25
MMGAVIAVMRGVAPHDFLDTALSKTKVVNVPTAPELGLFLQECVFDSYNRKHGNVHGPLNLESFQEQADSFKRERLYTHIARKEKAEGPFAQWLKELNERNYKFTQVKTPEEMGDDRCKE